MKGILDAYGQKYKMSKDGKILKLPWMTRRYKFIDGSWWYSCSTFFGISHFWHKGVFSIYDDLAEHLTK